MNDFDRRTFGPLSPYRRSRRASYFMRPTPDPFVRSALSLFLSAALILLKNCVSNGGRNDPKDRENGTDTDEQEL